MALAATVRGSAQGGSSHGLGGVTTGSFTPSNGSLLCAIAGAQWSGGGGDSSGTLSIADTAGLTWTPRGNVGTAAAFGAGIRLWTAPVTTGVSMTVTADCGAVDLNCLFLSVVDLTGYDTGAPVGVTGTDATIASNGADSLTLSGATAAESMVFGGRAGGPSGSGTCLATPDTGHTEAHDLNITDNAGLETMWRDAGSTSTAFSWADTSAGTAVLDGGCVGVAIEVMSDEPAEPPPDLVQYQPVTSGLRH